MITLEQYREAYLEQNPDATDDEIGRGYMRTIGAPTFLGELSSGLTRGAGHIVEAIGAAVRMVSGDEAGQNAVDLGEEIVNNAPRHPELMGYVLDNPALMLDFNWWAGGVGELIPSLAIQGGVAGATLKAGLTGKMAIGSAALTGGALEGLPTYNTLRDQGMGQPEAMARTGANVAGIGALNLLPLSRAFGYGPTRGVLNRVISTGLAEGVTETAEEPLQAIIEGNDPVQALYQGANVFPVAALTGGLLGGAGGLSQPSPQQQQQQPPVSPPTLTAQQQADLQNNTPLSRTLDESQTEPQFDKQGAQIRPPSSGWEQNISTKMLDYGLSIQLKTPDIDFKADNTLESVIDSPELFTHYPQLRNVVVAKLPANLRNKMESRSVPGRIEIAAPASTGLKSDLQQQSMTLALAREVKRQIAFAEGLVLPRKAKMIISDEQQAELDTKVHQFRVDQDVEPYSRAEEIYLAQLRDELVPGAPIHIDDIVEDQGNVKLALTAQEARVLANSRKLDSTRQKAEQSQVRATPTETQAAPPQLEQAASGVPESEAQPTPSMETAASDAALIPVAQRAEPIEGEDAAEMIALPEFAGNLRLANFDAADVNKEAMVAMAELEEDFINRRRRMPKGKSREISQDRIDARKILAYKAGTTIKDLEKSKVGEAFNAAEMMALGETLEGAARQMRRAINAFNEDPTDHNKLQAMKSFAKMRKLQALVSGARTEAGRALRILQESVKESEQLSMLTKLYDNFEDAMAAMASGADINEVARTAASYEARATAADVLMEVWVANLLTGGTTHAVNMLSNSLTSWLYRAELFMAMGIGKLTGKNVLTYRDVMAYSMGQMSDVIEGMAQAKIAWKTEADVFDAAKLDTHRFKAIRSDRLGLKKNSVLIDKLGRGIRTPFRLLMSEDAYFKTRAYRRRLKQLGVRAALEENPDASHEDLVNAIEQVLAHPTKAQKADAIAHANYLTFTNKTGYIAAAARKLVSDFPVLKFIAPFISTPANIVKFAFARTPVAFLMKNSERLALTGQRGIEAQQMARARVLMGSSIMMLMGWMAATGLITGAPPRDPRDRRLWYAQNAQPYSVKVGDTWYAYGRLEPLGMLVGMSADFASMYQFMDADDAEVHEMAGALTASMAHNLLSKTWLKGVSDLILAVVDSERYGASWVQSFSGTLIPTGVAQMARADDPLLRYTTTVWDKLQSRIPGMTDNIPARVDVWGNDISLAPQDSNALVNFFNPIYLRKVANDPVAKEMLRMKVGISAARKSMGAYRLSPEEYVDYSRIRGRLAHRMLAATMASPDYRIAPDYIKVEMLEKAKTRASRLAREVFVQRNPQVEISKILAGAREKANFTARELLF